MPRILFVEDHDDTRELLCELLRASGFDVHGVASAEEALEALRTGAFGLLITDHWLQGGNTGSWLVTQAAAEGILPPAIVCTAERTLPQLPANVAIVRKPVDVDRLLREIERASRPVVSVSPSGPSPAAGPVVRLVPPPPISGEELRSDRLDLVLYVTRSQCSLRGLRNLQRFLARYPGSQVTLSIVDVAERPLDSSTSADRIAFTPMLVKRGPGMRERLVGDFQDTEALEDLFSRSGLQPLEVVA